MNKIETRLQELRVEEARLEAQLETAKSRKTFECVVCGKHHRIRDCTAIQTHYYRDEPYAEHWEMSELWIRCPERPKFANRILFLSDYKLPYEERHKPENDRDDKFRRNYGHLFKNVEAQYDGPAPTWVNNDYFDIHAAQFGLTEGEKPEQVRLRATYFAARAEAEKEASRREVEKELSRLQVLENRHPHQAAPPLDREALLKKALEAAEEAETKYAMSPGDHMGKTPHGQRRAGILAALAVLRQDKGGVQ